MPREPSPYRVTDIDEPTVTTKKPGSGPSFVRFLGTGFVWYLITFVVCLAWINLDPHWEDNGALKLIAIRWRFVFAALAALPLGFTTVPLLYAILATRDYSRSQDPKSPPSPRVRP